MAHAVDPVDTYIASRAEAARPILVEIRNLVQAAVPGAPESIRYGMPAVALGDGYRLYFAAWKRHVGLYPIGVLDDSLEADLASYRSGRDTVRFPLNAPIPYPLIRRVVTAIAVKHQAAATPL